MAGRGYRIALLGATGVVGEEILRVLEERDLPVRELRAFASEASAGMQVEFRDRSLPLELVRPERLAGVDLVICAAPGLLSDLLPQIEGGAARIVDVSGALELNPEVPLYLPGQRRAGGAGTRLAVPRGAAAGLGLALWPIQREAPLERLTALVLESASGAGRGGVSELSAQTVELLNAMTGDPGEALVFPQPLAFDCLPQVGELLEGGDSSEERRLQHVLRRLLGAPGLPIEVTRVRVPTFSGSLACAHAALSRELSPDAARAIWEKQPHLQVLGEGLLPTPRASVGGDDVLIGRIRSGGGSQNLAFALALDDLRRGAALGAVEAAELLLEGVA